MAGLKHSRQRDAIAENLRHRKDHPTADMIYKDIRNVYPNISLGTVYGICRCWLSLGRPRRSQQEQGRNTTMVTRARTIILSAEAAAMYWI